MNYRYIRPVQAAVAAFMAASLVLSCSGGQKDEGKAAVAGRVAGMNVEAPSLAEGTPANPTTYVWEQVSVQAEPVPRGYPATASYPGLDKALMFGGYGPYGKLDDTWELEYAADTGLFKWIMKTPAARPPARGHCAAAYDPISKKIVLYGEGADTWLWDGTNWTNAGASVGYLESPSMATDTGHGNIFMFGGNTGSAASADTWEWTGTAWNKILTNLSPPARYKAAMAYFPDYGKTVLFGGFDGTNVLADTWLWDGADVWQAGPASSAQGGLYDVAMEYDSERHTMVLTGGRRGDGSLNSDTWEFNGIAWNQMQVPTFQNASAGGAAFRLDPSAAVVAFGGEDKDGLFNNSVFKLKDSGTMEWIDGTPPAPEVPSPRKNHAMAQAPSSGVILFGGTAPSGYYINQDIAWTWNGDAWSRVAVPDELAPRAQLGMAYGGSPGGILLFGGKGVGGSLGDTWRWDGSDWSEMAGAGPSARYGHSLAYDGSSARNEFVLFGGYTTLSKKDTWTWQTVPGWTAKAATTMPARYDYAMAYDAERGVVILFGGYDNGFYYQDTWAWNGSTWTDMNPATKPSARKGHVMVYNPHRKKIVMFGGYQVAAPPNSLNDTWEWDGSNWTNAATPVAPGNRAYNSGAYDPARRRMVIFGGEDKEGLESGKYLGDTWEYHAFGGSCSADEQCDTAHCVTGTCCEDDACNPGQCDITRVCDPVTGHCKVTQYQPDTHDCSTGNLCSINDKCDGKGVCKSGGTKPCSGDQCHDGYCDEADGQCKLKCIQETDQQVCARLGKDCGAVSAADCCGQQRQLDCGTCSNGYGCVDNVCTCESEKLCDVHCCGSATDVCYQDDCCTQEDDPGFCTRLQKNCGDVTAPDNCGVERTVGCGNCTDGFGCVGNVCTCVSGRLCNSTCCGSASDVCYQDACCTKESDQDFCTRLQKNCGDVTAPDNCGEVRTVACGTCSNGYGCVDNVCTCESGKLCDVHCCGSASDVCYENDCCTREGDQAFCTRLQKNCGDVTAPDNCGIEKTVDCGTCTDGYGCVGNVCTCESGKLCGVHCCGSASDVCFSGECCTKLNKDAVCEGKCGSMPDGCGGTYDCGGCDTCKNVCSSNVCESTKHASARCDGNDVYWYDSCDVKEDVKESCTAPQVCAVDECCTPESDSEFCTRVGKQCGQVTAPDNCGASRTAQCGTCSTTNACDTAVCGSDNMCSTSHKPDTASCSTGGLCSTGDHCDGAGKCVSGGNKTCTGDQCNDGYCDKVDGKCKLRPNGTSTLCKTGDPCSVDDHCDGAGKCVSGGTKPSCTDGGTSDAGGDSGVADSGEPDGGGPDPSKGCSCSTLSL